MSLTFPYYTFTIITIASIVNIDTYLSQRVTNLIEMNFSAGKVFYV